MKQKWVQAGGEYQLPFIGAATCPLEGDFETPCPRCHEASLRFYFHVFNPTKATGTLWVWCPVCKTVCHLPRVNPAPETGVWTDPYKNLPNEEFGQLESDENEGFFDRLERLWAERAIGYPDAQG